MEKDLIRKCPICDHTRLAPISSITEKDLKIAYQITVINDLNDKLYHATREVDEVKYLLGHKVEVLEKQNKIMRDALVHIKDGNSNSAKLDAFYALKEIEGLT